MNCLQIEESNEMGTGVLPAVDNKGKEPVHPMPEVMVPPTAKEDPKTPTVGDDERMEEPPTTSAITTATTMRRVAQLTSARSSLHRSLSASPCPWTSPSTSSLCRLSSS